MKLVSAPEAKMTPEDLKDLTVPRQLLSPWLGFVLPRAEPAARPAAPRSEDRLPKAA